MRAKPNRPINDDEIDFVRTALERCAVTTNVEKHVSGVSSLRVVDQCQCGCPSVDFARTGSQAPQLVADGLGITVNGDSVGIIVWGVEDSVTALEIYDMSANASEVKLNDIKSIISWEEGGEEGAAQPSGKDGVL